MSNAEMVLVHPEVLATLQRRAAAADGVQLQNWGQRAAMRLHEEGSTHGREALKPMAYGGVLAFVASLEDVKNMEIIKEHWWLLPVAVIAIGYILQRKKDQFGQPNRNGQLLLALGTFMFVNAWQSQPKKEAKTDTTTTTTTKTDTGALDDDTVWLPTPTGQWVRLRTSQLRQWMPANGTAAVQDAAAHLAAAAFAA